MTLSAFFLSLLALGVLACLALAHAERLPSWAQVFLIRWLLGSAILALAVALGRLITWKVLP